MCLSATASLPGEPRSTPAARRFLRERFAAWELEDLLDEAEVAVSELVTNAVLHARTPLRVSLGVAEGVVEIVVFDGSPVLPQLRPHREDLDADLDAVLSAESDLADGSDLAGLAEPADRDPRLHVGAAGSVAGGRGLLLVQALAAEWGVSPLSDGKAVWIRTPAPDGWRPAVPCRCGPGDDALR